MSAHGQRRQPGGEGDVVRERITKAMVSVAGTHGYDVTTIEAVCARAEVPVSEFESCFADREECFLHAFDQIAVAFGDRVFSAYDAPRAWHDKMWAVLWEGVGFLHEDPLRARFLIVEVDGAGARAQVRRDRIMQNFADLIDAGRDQLDDPGALSRATAEMVAGAIHYLIKNKIMEGCLDRGEDFVVELVYIAVLPYLGGSTAEADLRVQPLREVR